MKISSINKIQRASYLSKRLDARDKQLEALEKKILLLDELISKAKSLNFTKKSQHIV